MEEKKEIYNALIEFQNGVSKIYTDALNPHFKNKYATLNGILDTIKPALISNGLSVIQEPLSREDGAIGVKTTLIHKSGQVIEAEPFYLKPTQNNPQQAGSALTYAKRYSLCALLNISVDVDDDGNGASARDTKDNNNKPTPPPQPPAPKLEIIKYNTNKAKQLIEKARNGISPVQLRVNLEKHYNCKIEFEERLFIELDDAYNSYLAKVAENKEV